MTFEEAAGAKAASVNTLMNKLEKYVLFFIFWQINVAANAIIRRKSGKIL